jgi:phytoene dehydrogenase-like protein
VSIFFGSNPLNKKNVRSILTQLFRSKRAGWWEGLDRDSEEYKQKKEEAADFLWTAIEEYVPNARDRAIPGTVQIGTPLTHERFLRRTRGTYGPRAEVGLGQTLPGHTTPIEGMYLVGDFTFPGIGVPATAASGAIAANTIVSVWDHLEMLKKVRLPLKS